MTTAMTLCLAMLLDAIMGEPKWLWDRITHPAVAMGKIIGWCDDHLNAGPTPKFNGIVAVVLLSIGALVLGSFLSLFGPLMEIIVVAILLAQRSLVDHVKSVGDALRVSLGDGRRMVARIVSRDTREMEESAVARSAIESASENLSDGIIAPAFWFLLAGLPGLLLYKVINTSDSMIGYRTPKHREFGWAAARLDDLLNLIPARLTAILIALPAGQIGQWREIATDARRHKSPNAGWPEAAMARSLNVALAGPRSYDGITTNFNFVHPTGEKKLDASHIDQSVTKLWQTWALAFILCALIAII